MRTRFTFVTLGVRHLEQASAFYSSVMGLPPLPSPPNTAFLDLGGITLALYTRELLAADSGIADNGDAFRSFALSLNLPTARDVDTLLQSAAAGGGAIIKPGAPTAWGGYAGYLADPDGFLWEAVWNPKVTVSPAAL